MLQHGTRLGPYEIVSAIGAGGMGEVYKARDTRLKRDVAIKVLLEGFSQDPDRLAPSAPARWGEVAPPERRPLGRPGWRRRPSSEERT